MRGSLKSVVARVERIAEKIHPPAEDLSAKFDAMRDGELEAYGLRFAESLVGPIATFDSEDAVADAVAASMTSATDQQLSDSRDSGLLCVACEQWNRLHWLRAHVAHGSLTLTMPDWGHVVVAACESCGMVLKMYSELVPEEFRESVQEAPYPALSSYLESHGPWSNRIKAKQAI